MTPETTVPDADALRILVIDRMPPISLVQGNALIGRHLFGRLAAMHRLTLVCPLGPDDRATVEPALRNVFEDVHLVDAPAPSALGGWVDAAMPAPLGGHRGSQQIRRVLRTLAESAPFDIVHVRQLPMAPFGRDVPARARLLELVDSETLGARRDRRTGWRRATRRRVAEAVERRALRDYDAVTTVGTADAAVLSSLASPGQPVYVMPNGVDAEAFSPLPIEDDGDGLVFVGAMSYPPNVDAVTAFVRQVLPRVRAARPRATFTIVGRDPAPAVRALASEPGVTVTGTVDDVRPYVRDAAIVVCPMRSGSGIKNKLLEAFAMARPVVASSLAVEGTRAVPGRDVCIADGPEAFATEVIRLLAEPAERRHLAMHGRLLVERSYSWDACAARYASLYRILTCNPARSTARRADTGQGRSPTVTEG